MPEKRYRVEIRKKNWWSRPPHEVFEGLTRCNDGSYTMTATESALPRIRETARRNRYRLTCTDTRFVRSNKYRETYFKEAETVRGKYRCAYCGRLLPKEKITVDHIIPVHEAQNSPLARLYLKLEGADTVNARENLTGACERCNKSKGSQLSLLWVAKAALGNRPGYWAERRAAAAVILLMFAALCLSYFDGTAAATSEAIVEGFGMADMYIAWILRSLLVFL